MTDFTSTAPLSLSRSSLPRLRLPKIGVGASLAAIAGLFGHALNLAYVDPYTSLKLEPSVIPDDDLEGRDPNW